MAGEISGLPGYVWLYPGKSNLYGVTVTTRTAYDPLSGERLTVRQVNTLQHGGFSFERRREMLRRPQSESVLAAYVEEYARQNGVELSREQALAPGSEFWAIQHDLQDTTGERTGSKGQKIYPPDGRRARALVKLGRRAPEADWWVGETP